MSESKLPSDIDRVVGQNIHRQRRKLKLTQEKLGELLGLTFQQVQKYEKGVNRVSAGRLYEIAGVLEVPVEFFFDGADTVVSNGVAELAEDLDDTQLAVLSDEVLQLIEAFQKIEDAALRGSLLATVRAAASAFDTRANSDRSRDD
ncbi:DNA-binding protein [Hyphomonas neptunium ATCC 15444]|uniref:DNA-binding protein n=2 Tax=Hyphomonas TaxID=85 RepID=Q0C601_HYPNA|nr:MULTISPECIES: helix-turn-helix transcriptional regulator [Hyphomonas]ABI77824.1 DNA-binding protein [Hyphomonas neptunium ATCC 15444]KCZ94920.1 DNA-binding protein [Hyphomonas hirschiana VP5]